MHPPLTNHIPNPPTHRSNYFDQDPDAPIEHRFGEAMALAGSSMTVSCCTNIIAFAIGAYTSLEALRSFSIYASVSTLFVFILQVRGAQALAAVAKDAVAVQGPRLPLIIGSRPFTDDVHPALAPPRRSRCSPPSLCWTHAASCASAATPAAAGASPRPAAAR